MKLYDYMIKLVSSCLDKFAQIILCVSILLVVSNILLRVFFGSPILGTYEYVGFCSSLIIGLSLAYCALQNGNIAVEFFHQKLSPKIQVVTDSIMGIAAFVFFIFAAWHMSRFAYSMVLSGEVAASTGTPVYYFVYLVTFGILMLCLVLLSQIINTIRQVRHK
ncbi:MAG TPA: TRAP transporter small permease [Firmicutes bacterium]|nr:TRAP transporter small permease [Bacillota bacterium]